MSGEIFQKAGEICDSLLDKISDFGDPSIEHRIVAQVKDALLHEGWEADDYHVAISEVVASKLKACRGG